MYPKPKKRLGQNFLVDPNIRRKIIDTLDLQAGDTVLEIGPGRGELTALIAETAGKVIAVEFDPGLFIKLNETLKDSLNVSVVQEDILKLDFDKYFPSCAEKIKVFGNIPYNISTPIIQYLFTHNRNIKSIFITVQKEFAQRMCAPAGTQHYSSLSCFVRYHSTPIIVFNIKSSCFFPKPKVDSSFVRLDIREKPLLERKEEAELFEIIRSAFGKRRKTLRNSLKDTLAAETLETFFNKYSIDRNARPETLALADFVNLAKLLNIFKKKIDK